MSEASYTHTISIAIFCLVCLLIFFGDLEWGDAFCLVLFVTVCAAVVFYISNYQFPVIVTVLSCMSLLILQQRDHEQKILQIRTKLQLELMETLKTQTLAKDQKMNQQRAQHVLYMNQQRAEHVKQAQKLQDDFKMLEDSALLERMWWEENHQALLQMLLSHRNP